MNQSQRTKQLEKAIREIRTRRDKLPERQDYFITEAANKYGVTEENIRTVLIRKN